MSKRFSFSPDTVIYPSPVEWKILYMFFISQIIMIVLVFNLFMLRKTVDLPVKITDRKILQQTQAKVCCECLVCCHAM